MLKGFKQFILRGSVVDLAVGVIIGAAFQGVISSLVKDIFTPLISAITKLPDFSKLKFHINAVEFRYGDFINSLLSFLIVGIAVYFFVVLPLNALVAKAHKQAPADPNTKKCTECLSAIPLEAKRCAFCTQPQ